MTTYEFDCQNSATGKMMHIKIDQDDEFLNTTVDGSYLGILVMDFSELGYSTNDEALKPLLADIVKCL